MTAAVPLSLYVHLPWCIRKCPYCDFHSLPTRGQNLPEKSYVEALRRDLQSMVAAFSARPLQSVFFGGGTPSLFSSEAIADILAEMATIGTLTADCEITLEANPGTVDASRFRAFREAGVNRLSVGIQSFHDSHLARLGRIHGARAAHEALDAATAAGFHSFNIDLMYGLPGQTVDDARRDIDCALAADPAHLSLYELTIEPHTAFAHDPPPLPDESVRAAIEECVREAAQAAGLRRYEISAYAKDGFRCRHNLNYWQFGDYVGVGSGAHAKLTDSAGIWRETRTRDVQRYQQDPHHARERYRVDNDTLLWEFLLNGLRLTEGFVIADFPARTGLPATKLTQRLRQAVATGLIRITDDRIGATEHGLRFLDSILAPLVPDVCAYN